MTCPLVENGVWHIPTGWYIKPFSIAVFYVTKFIDYQLKMVCNHFPTDIYEKNNNNRTHDPTALSSYVSDAHEAFDTHPFEHGAQEALYLTMQSGLKF